MMRLGLVVLCLLGLAAPAQADRLLPALYVSTAVAHALDAHATIGALSHGGREANPIMAGISSHPAALVATKAATAAATIVLAQHLAKRSRRAAVVTLVAVNTVVAAVAAHNYRIR